MSEETETGDDSPFLNTEKLEKFFSLYKFPIISGIVGFILLVAAIGLLVKTRQQGSQDIVFSTTASSSAQSKIHIDIAGAVQNPGVYEVEEGARIQDALITAGGLSASADREWLAKNLNRAAKLVDGGKIYIPSVTEVTSSQVQSSKVNPPAGGQSSGNLSNLGNTSNLLGISIGKVNINTASTAELDSIPGIGQVTAGKIITGRPYQSIDDLKNRKIIGTAVYNKIKDLIAVY